MGSSAIYKKGNNFCNFLFFSGSHYKYGSTLKRKVLLLICSLWAKFVSLGADLQKEYKDKNVEVASPESILRQLNRVAARLVLVSRVCI